jgi:hypothetical protein
MPMAALLRSIKLFLGGIMARYASL